MTHDTACPQATEFYSVINGWVWIACRRCTATQVRRPAKEATA